jgi:periplasmic divalent cation tolerance protein
MPDNESDAVVVLLTTGTRDEAVRIAEMLVGSRLAACVQIMPEMESIYRWNDELRRDSETLLLAKSTAESFNELERAVRSVHSYETPEIVALPVTAVSAPYLKWLMENVTRAAGLSSGMAGDQAAAV